MNRWREGFIGLQVALLTATMGIASLVAIPQYRALSERVVVTEALTFAANVQDKLAHRVMVTGRFPTTNRHASSMISSRIALPEFIRDIRIQPDRTGETATIKVFLRDGAVKNPTGELQYIYIAGNRTSSDRGPIEWRCGAAGLGADLLPDDCRR